MRYKDTCTGTLPVKYRSRKSLWSRRSSPPVIEGSPVVVAIGVYDPDLQPGQFFAWLMWFCAPRSALVPFHHERSDSMHSGGKNWWRWRQIERSGLKERNQAAGVGAKLLMHQVYSTACSLNPLRVHQNLHNEYIYIFTYVYSTLYTMF